MTNPTSLTNQEMNQLYLIALNNQKIADELPLGISSLEQDESDIQSLGYNVKQLVDLINADPNATTAMKEISQKMYGCAEEMFVDVEHLQFDQASDMVNNINAAAEYLISGKN